MIYKAFLIKFPVFETRKYLSVRGYCVKEFSTYRVIKLIDPLFYIDLKTGIISSAHLDIKRSYDVSNKYCEPLKIKLV